MMVTIEYFWRFQRFETIAPTLLACPVFAWLLWPQFCLRILHRRRHRFIYFFFDEAQEMKMTRAKPLLQIGQLPLEYVDEYELHSHTVRPKVKFRAYFFILFEYQRQRV